MTFSFGGSNTLEPRPSEVKGLMRMVFRSLSKNKLNIEEILEKEKELFGGVNKEAVASPIWIRMTKDEKTVKDYKRLLLHDKAKNRSNGPSFYAYLPDQSFHITLTQSPYKTKARYSLEYYNNLLELSLLLGGIGRRSRRGRGCLSTEFSRSMTTTGLLQWAAERMNYYADSKEEQLYILSEDKCEIHRDASNSPELPVILKVRVGGEISDVEEFLKKVDEESHYFKKENNRNAWVTGDAGRYNKLSSPIIVTLIETKDGIYPLYIYLKLINKKYQNGGGDREYTLRDEYVDNIERGGNK